MSPEEEKQIYENNKLLCKFLNYKLYEKKGINGVFAWDVHNDISFVGAELNGTLDFPKNLHFHEDWNWIMCIVDRIEEMNDKEFTISTNRVDTLVNPIVCEGALGGWVSEKISPDLDKLLATWTVCVTYVKVYFKIY